MKKILAMLLAFSIVLMFGACAKGGTENSSSDTSNESVTDTSNDSGAEIVDEDGTKFIVDTSKRGEVKSDACGIDGTEIVIDGIKFEMPVKVSDFLDNGFELTATFNPVGANTKSGVLNGTVSKDDHRAFDIETVVNNTDSELDFEDCYVTKIGVNSINSDAVFPGGITMKSTAGDVLAVFGNPAYNGDDYLHYGDDNSKVQYSFNFNTAEDGNDGSMSSMHFEMNPDVLK